VNQSNKGLATPGVTVVLATGGTIAGRSAQVDDHVGYLAGQIGVVDLLASAPGLTGLPLEGDQVAQIDSKDMSLPVWQALVRRLVHHLARAEVGSVVITHGTDTLEETAYLLHALLPSNKPVVLTCAMRPATALMADGPQNLMDAVSLSRHASATGVLVVCAGEVHTGLEVSKVHSYRLDAFDSGDAGAMGVMEMGQLRLFRAFPVSAQPTAARALQLERFLLTEALPLVELLTSHADADGDMVRALLVRPTERPLRGLVVAGTGNGSVNQPLEDALVEAQAGGVRVVRTTRCARGTVLERPGHALPEISGLSPVKARLALALALLAD
jgi:L-asparaginase